MLQETFIQLVSNFTNKHGLIHELWTEIETKYSNKKRHYHSLVHLQNLLIQLTSIKSNINNWQVILFSLFYHDIVYNTLKTNNEEKSAELAEKRMLEMDVDAEKIKLCKNQIVATKSHIISSDSDTNYFTDADLSILGQPWETYEAYLKNVRKEYAVYPNIIYNPGRKKVLLHFLAMDRIYKTQFFYDTFEIQAKQNLQKEMELYRNEIQNSSICFMSV